VTVSLRDTGQCLVRFRLVSGVKWRCWSDGVVIFAPASAQTTLLSYEAATLIEALAQPEGVLCEKAERARSPVLDHLLRMAAVESRP